MNQGMDQGPGLWNTATFPLAQMETAQTVQCERACCTLALAWACGVRISEGFCCLLVSDNFISSIVAGVGHNGHQRGPRGANPQRQEPMWSDYQAQRPEHRPLGDPAWYEWRFYAQAGEPQWYCVACGAWVSEGHLQSIKHSKKVWWWRQSQGQQPGPGVWPGAAGGHTGCVMSLMNGGVGSQTPPSQDSSSAASIASAPSARAPAPAPPASAPAWEEPAPPAPARVAVSTAGTASAAATTAGWPATSAFAKAPPGMSGGITAPPGLTSPAPPPLAGQGTSQGLAQGLAQGAATAAATASATDTVWADWANHLAVQVQNLSEHLIHVLNRLAALEARLQSIEAGMGHNER